MSELEKLKAISAEVHSRMEGGGDSLIMWNEVVKHFDRAIAIAEANDEGWQQASRLIQDCGESRKTMEKERDEARAELAGINAQFDAALEDYAECERDRDEARAAVLTLRDALKNYAYDDDTQPLVDTESYELYR